MVRSAGGGSGPSPLIPAESNSEVIDSRTSLTNAPAPEAVPGADATHSFVTVTTNGQAETHYLGSVDSQGNNFTITTPGPVESEETVLRTYLDANRLPTVEMPHMNVDLQPEDIVIHSGGFEQADVAHVSIPLASLNTEPLSLEEFIDQLDYVVMPDLWGEGLDKPVSIEVVGEGSEARLKAEFSDTHLGAWSQVEPKLSVMLKSGQHLLLDLNASAITLDTTQETRNQLQEKLTETRERLADFQADLTQDLAALEDPSQIPSVGDLQARIDGYHAQKQEALAGKAARLETMTTFLDALPSTDQRMLATMVKSAQGHSPEVQAQLDRIVGQMGDAHVQLYKDNKRLDHIDNELDTLESVLDKNPQLTGIEERVDAFHNERETLLQRVETLEDSLPELWTEFQNLVSKHNLQDVAFPIAEAFMPERPEQEWRTFDRLAQRADENIQRFEEKKQAVVENWPKHVEAQQATMARWESEIQSLESQLADLTTERHTIPTRFA
ncbi:MAG: hypothetical protein EP343_18290 [Deltaproteobacteria bacterium]|nr:MAG: hypothetical protein EP343_18290 [Deltaproteobacteria bacterium]